MTALLDLPDELLIRCLAGSGGLGIGSSSVTCTRLHAVARRLWQLPIFSSALSTNASLQHAIQDAGKRALVGCYGAVDFALLFVANYGSARGKKYSEPTDLAHAVEMLRVVLGQDIVIVGCACAGLMGVGPDSLPVEVDPLSNLSQGRAAAAARRKAGRSALPIKGVSVLLGRLPPGCVARGFAQETMSGPPAPADPESDPATWSWPFLDDTLALTSSQKAALAQQLQASARTGHPRRPVAAGNSRSGSSENSTDAGLSQALQAATELGASPETAAAADGLLSVVAAAAAAAAEPQGVGNAAAGGGGEDDVRLVPQLCLMFYDNSLQSFGYTQSTEMERALNYLAAKGVSVVGGASSGAGDLFYSPGADARRLAGDPPATAQMVGLMLCIAQAPVPAAASTAMASAATPAGALDVSITEQPPMTMATTAAAAASSSRSLSQLSGTAASRAFVDSSAALHTAAFAALGLGPSLHTPLFTGLHAKIASSHALSVNHIAVQLEVDACNMVPASAPAQATPAAEQAPAGATDAAPPEPDAPGPVDSPAAAAAGPSGPAEPDAPGPVDSPAAAAASAPTENQPSLAAAAGSSGAAALGPVAIRRSQRLAATGAGTGASPLPLSTLQHLYAAVTAGAPIASFDDDEDDSGQYLAVWVCPQGTTPAHFTGEEGQVAVCELLACELEHRAAAGPPNHSRGAEYVEITTAVHASSYAALRDLINNAPPGSSLCCQVVGTKPAACARTVSRCLSQMLPMIHHTAIDTPSVPAGPAGAGRGAADAGASAAAGGVRAMQDCYDALARCAVASGARSGLQGVTVCCCTGRGQSLYADGDNPAAFGEVTEAQMIDSVGGRGVPFVGVYVSGELGPEVHHMCCGWGRTDEGVVGVAEMQGFTSMFAGWGCLPGVA